MASAPSPGGGGYQYRSRFGDTTLTKVFVGGLAWETPSEELHRHFEQFGDILEAVVITDKNTGRSKGYGFVTFREPDSARRAVAEANPFIDGRRANCNIAAHGRPRPSPPRGRAQVQGGSPYQVAGGGPQPAGPSSHQSNRIPPQMPFQPPLVYHPQYGYMTYTATDYGYHQAAIYNSQLAAQYPHHMYGPSSPSPAGYGPYSPVGYASSPRPGYGVGGQQQGQGGAIRMQGTTPPLASVPLPYGHPYSPMQGAGVGAFLPPSASPPPQQGQVVQLQPPPTLRNQQQHQQQQQAYKPSASAAVTELAEPEAPQDTQPPQPSKTEGDNEATDS